MFNMVNNLFDFVNWAQAVMNQNNVTQADIARTGFVKSAAVSMFFSYKTKSVGVDMCRAISAATGIPLRTVYEKAGLLPVTAEDPDQAEIDALLAQLEPDLRQQAKDYLYMLGEKQAKRRRFSSSTN
jgi:transcriptional regulator with XRE-family HTH domain